MRGFIPPMHIVQLTEEDLEKAVEAQRLVDKKISIEYLYRTRVLCGSLIVTPDGVQLDFIY